VALAGEDEGHLLSRLDAWRQAVLERGAEGWERAEKALHVIELNKAVSINMHPETLVNILQDEKLRYVNLHDNLRARAILDYPPDWAAKRRGIDNLAFGNDGELLTFGALNLGTLGLYSYGACCVFLKSEELSDNLSFLERNSFSYCNVEGPAVSFYIPLGVRALWSTVPKLAILKLHEAILATAAADQRMLADLVLKCEGDKSTDEFIEAQIFPPITMTCFKKVLYNPKITRPIRSKGTVGKSAKLSRRLLGEYLKSLEGDIAVEIIGRDE